jgi:hypothetical protein
MWVCPTCKVYMKLGGEPVCIICRKEIQYFENIKRIKLESMIVCLKLSEYLDIQSK